MPGFVDMSPISMMGTQRMNANEELLRKYGRHGALVQLPNKPAERLLVLAWFAEQFTTGQEYTESAVNDRLRGHALDHVTLRRLLIDYGFLERPDGRYRLLPEPLPAHTGIAHDGRRIFPSKVRTAPPVEPAGDDEV